MNETITTPIDEFLSQRELSNEVIKAYFSKMPRYRGQYYVQMKVCVSKWLRSQGLTLASISGIIYGNPNRHDTILHHLKHYRDIVDADIVKSNYKQWILQGLYPKSKHVHKKIEDPFYGGGKVQVNETKLVLERMVSEEFSKLEP
jgi:hypothetical protein